MYLLAMIGPLSQWQTIGAIVVILGLLFILVLRKLRSSTRNEEYIGSKSNRPSRDVQQKRTSNPSIIKVILGIFAVSLIIYIIIGAFIPEKLLYPIKNKISRNYTLVYTFIGSTQEMPATKTNVRGNGFVKLKFHISYELTRQVDGWFWQDSAEVIMNAKSKLANMMPELDQHSSMQILSDLWKTNPIKNVSLNYLAYPEASKATNDRFMRNTGATKALFSYVFENDKGKKTFGMTQPIEIKNDEASVESGNSYSVRIPFQQQTTTTIATMTFTYTNTHSATVSTKISSPNTGKDMLIKADCDFEYQVVAKKEIPEGEHTMDELHEQFGSKIRKAVSTVVDNHGNQIAVSVAYQLQPELSEVNRDFLQSANIRHTPYDKLAELLTSRLRDKLSNDKEATVNYIRLEVNNITAEIVPTE